MSLFSIARQKMVDGQVRPNDVTGLRILDAMLTVPREAFVPESKRALAYLDCNLDITEGSSAKRFLIKPALIGKMLQAAEIRETDGVLVAGCATGYTAALVARLAGRVTATETDPVHATIAKKVLAGLGIGNVNFVSKVAAQDEPANALYDVIVLDGATEVVPDRLFEQLKEGGRLVGVFALTEPPKATIVTRSHGDLGHRALFDASAPVLPGFERTPAFVF
jgi:protein-L-isoaspartate(D-aspartate) O-methyltransferase